MIAVSWSVGVVTSFQCLSGSVDIDDTRLRVFRQVLVRVFTWTRSGFSFPDHTLLLSYGLSLGSVYPRPDCRPSFVGSSCVVSFLPESERNVSSKKREIEEIKEKKNGPHFNFRLRKDLLNHPYDPQSPLSICQVVMFVIFEQK